MPKTTGSKIINSPTSTASTSRSVPLEKVAGYLEKLLDHRNIADWSQALNGLQLENTGAVHRIGAAVDACEATLEAAAERGIDLLLVHHGLFWNGLRRIEGAAYRKLRLAISANLAVFSSHLPLDIHPTLGNNAQLAHALGLRRTTPFFPEKGSLIGVKARAALSRDALHRKLERAVGGPVKLIGGGPEKTGVVGIVTGGAGGEVFKAAAEGVDTFITGEGPHWCYTAAEELGLNVFLAGHYATETFGVKALAAHLAKKYRLPWEFLDHPTGL